MILQKDELEKVFNQENNPDASMRQELALKLNLSERAVTVIVDIFFSLLILLLLFRRGTEIEDPGRSKILHHLVLEIRLIIF